MPAHPLPIASLHLSVRAEGLRWFDWGRYSQRQQQEMQLGGLLGSVLLQGDLAPFAQLLHPGPMAAYRQKRQLLPGWLPAASRCGPVCRLSHPQIKGERPAGSAAKSITFIKRRCLRILGIHQKHAHAHGLAH